MTTPEGAQMEKDREFVLARWKSARALQGSRKADLSDVQFAVFVGSASLKGGNGLRRKSKWAETEAEAWANARGVLEAKEGKDAKR